MLRNVYKCNKSLTNASINTQIADNFSIMFNAKAISTASVSSEGGKYGGVYSSRFFMLSNNGSNRNYLGLCLALGTNSFIIACHGYDNAHMLLRYDGDLSGWNNFCVVFEDRTPKLYVNGELMRTGQRALKEIRLNTDFMYSNNWGSMYDGYICNIVGFNKVLNNEEIESLYFTDTDDTSEGIVFNFKFDEGSGDSIADSCGIYSFVAEDTWDNQDVPMREPEWTIISKYLFQDGNEIKTVQDGILATIGTAPATVDMFKYGMSKDMVNSVLQDRNSFEYSKPKILYYTDEETPTIPSLNEAGTPYGQIVEQREGIDFNKSYINNLKNVTITANKGDNSILKFIVSKDGGVTWLSFKGTEWVSVEKSNIDMLDKGMGLDVINQLSEEDLRLISDTKKIKIAWYMKRANLEENVTVSHIKVDYNTSL